MNQLTGKGQELIPLQSMEDWQTRRQKAMEAMTEVMGSLPGDEKRCDLAVEIIEERDCGNFIRRLITYQSEPDSRTPAYLCIPKDVLADNSKVPAVLALHGANYITGHRSVVNLDSTSDRGYGTDLAERGYVVIGPAYPLLMNYRQRPESLGYISATMKAIWDNMRALDLLDELPYVNHDKYAAIGASLGGHNTLFTAAFEPRIKVAVSGCGFDSFLHYRDGDISLWAGDCYMPRLKEYAHEDIPFDFHDVLACIAPRPCFVSAPTEDFFRCDSAKWCVDSAREVYKLYDAENALETDYPECGHCFPQSSLEQAYVFIDKALGVETKPTRSIPMYQVDAFTGEGLRGNPAAVCVLDDWLDDDVMQSIAAENNLSETAFIVRNEAGFDLRWFTPATEVKLCGHATLASGWVVFACFDWPEEIVTFQTRWRGELTVEKSGGKLVMDFPGRMPEAIDAPSGLEDALGVKALEVFQADEDVMVLLENAEQILAARPDFAALSNVECRGIIITAPDDASDFVSRFFAPRCCVNEDPVTGSAHCVLAPFWAKRLGKQMLEARQLSSRGGAILCKVTGERVKLTGEVRPFFSGIINL